MVDNVRAGEVVSAVMISGLTLTPQTYEQPDCIHQLVLTARTVLPMTDEERARAMAVNGRPKDP